jgi:hypothetical protein
MELVRSLVAGINVAEEFRLEEYKHLSIHCLHMTRH